MASNNEFYFVTNVVARITDGDRLNHTLQDMYANIRFGPPLDSDKKYHPGLENLGFIGIYTKRENSVLPLRELVGEASVTLEDAIRMGMGSKR